jgi:hypothetical protein
VLALINNLFEKLIFTRVFGFLDSDGFFSNNQYGFRPKSSTATAISEIEYCGRYFLGSSEVI